MTVFDPSRFDVDLLLGIGLEAGGEILEVYRTDFTVEHKSDSSPLTIADKKAHRVITERLEDAYPGIAILSEEGKNIPFETRSRWDLFWLVDPLDGTKEFIKKNGEFTVNIALISRGMPVAGVVYAPDKDIMYFAMQGKGAFKMERFGERIRKNGRSNIALSAMKLPLEIPGRTFTVVGSRSHMSAETEEYINELKKTHGDLAFVSAGSSLKLCMVAEGRADVYPRFAPTMEWDTAAGQAIVEQAGGAVVSRETGKPLQYNKKNLLNPWFVVTRKGYGL